MIKFNLNAAVLMTLVTASVLAVSCKKDVQSGADGPISATQIIPPSGSTLSGILGTGKAIRDTILLAGGTFFLDKLVYVDELDVLQIAAGTVIKGIVSTPAIGSTPAVPGGGLVITRGGKIEANGTAAAPIIFTSAATAGTEKAGDISGIVILGKATTNVMDTPHVEGIGGLAVTDIRYGGSDDADNSGFLKYVKIKYAGFELTPDNELNGLTLAGVGSGTVIDNVLIYKAADDGVECFGGTVNITHLAVISPLDDALDFDEGYRGCIQYVLVVEDTTRADKSTSNGIESDNNAQGDPRTPVTDVKIANLTVIGLPNQALAIKNTYIPSGAGRYGAAAHIRRSSAFNIYNSVFLGFDRGLLIDETIPSGGTTSQSTYDWWNAFTSNFSSNLLHAFTTPNTSNPTFVPGRAYFGTTDKDTTFVTANPNLDIKLVNPFNRTVTGFYRPIISGSPAVLSRARHGGLTTGLPACLVGTAYRGAFDGTPANDWLSSWTTTADFAY